MIRNTSDGRWTFWVGVVLAERGCLVHNVRVIRSDGGVFGVDDVQDYGPKTSRGDLRLLSKNILLEVISKDAS